MPFFQISFQSNTLNIVSAECFLDLMTKIKDRYEINNDISIVYNNIAIDGDEAFLYLINSQQFGPLVVSIKENLENEENIDPSRYL